MKEFTLRVGSAICLPEIARRFGKDPAPAFAAAELNEAIIADPENRVSIIKLGRFASEIARLINRPDLGLLVARSYGPHSLGLVLLLAREGPNVRTALLNITRLLKHHNELAFLSLAELNGDAFLNYELRDSNFEGANIVITTALSIALQVMRQFCGEAWHPAEVRFSMARPKSSVPYETYFGAPIRFESPIDALVFPSSWLDLTVTPAHIDGYPRVLPPSAWDFTDHVSHQIAMRIGLEPVSATIVASVLGLSRRALDRKLASFGTSFKQLLDEVRFARARRLLGAAHAPISDISIVLGYAEPSAFSRAFRTWSGTSPKAWREIHNYSSGAGA